MAKSNMTRKTLAQIAAETRLESQLRDQKLQVEKEQFPYSIAKSTNKKTK